MGIQPLVISSGIILKLLYSHHFVPVPERSLLPHYFIWYFVLFHTCIYSPRARGDNSLGTILLWKQKGHHFDHWLHVSKIPLPSDFMHIFFYDFLHEYSLGRGRQPITAKILMSTERASSLILYTSFHDLINVYSSGHLVTSVIC